jgi:hypothetical protein
LQAVAAVAVQPQAQQAQAVAAQVVIRQAQQLL